MAASSAGNRGYLLTGHGGRGPSGLSSLAGVGDRGVAMRWGWLLPDASYEVLYDGWRRRSYQPRHGKRPFAIRGAYSLAMVLWRARERYLGAVEQESLAGASAGSVGTRGAAGARAAASVGTVGGGQAATGVSAVASRPRSADLVLASRLAWAPPPGAGVAARLAIQPGAVVGSTAPASAAVVADGIPQRQD